MRFYQNATEKGRNSFLYFITAIAVTFAFYLLTSLPFLFYSIMKGMSGTEVTQYQGPLSFALMLFVFAGILFGILVATRKVHKRAPISVLTGASTFRWARLWKAGLLWFVLLTIMEIIGYLAAPDMYTFQFDPAAFFPALIVALLVLPLQTSAEEVMMRGYLMQQIGLISRYRWIPIVITSLLFGLMHGANPEVAQYGAAKSMTLYISMGLFFGVVTIMDDGLEMPLGVHYINNFFAFLLVGYKGSVFEGVPTLFLKEMEELTWFAVISNVFVMIVVLLIFSKYFKWPPFNTLLKRIGGSQSSEV